MADMAAYDDTVDAWETIEDALRGESTRVIPITYVNSSAAIKAFVGDHGGACCTSTNAAQIFEWALAGGTEPVAHGEAVKLLFLPDQHLGRNTASRFGLLTEVDERAGRGLSETVVWNPRAAHGGLDAGTIRRARVLLWAGHCSVHKLFRPEHVDDARAKFADRGGVTVIVHPECCKEVVDLADLDGSTESIIRQVEAAAPGTNWAVGTEVHLVNRLAQEAKQRGVNVTMLSDCQCLCTTMYRIEPRNLAWVLDNLAAGKVVNRIEVNPQVKTLARLALDRMLAHAGSGATRPAAVV
jgi:quinolinate synthase